MIESSGNRRNIAGQNLLWLVGVVIVSAIAQLPPYVKAHAPQAAIAFEKQTVAAACGNFGHGLRFAGESA